MKSNKKGAKSTQTALKARKAAQNEQAQYFPLLPNTASLDLGKPPLEAQLGCLLIQYLERKDKDDKVKKPSTGHETESRVTSIKTSKKKLFHNEIRTKSHKPYVSNVTKWYTNNEPPSNIFEDLVKYKDTELGPPPEDLRSLGESGLIQAIPINGNSEILDIDHNFEQEGSSIFNETQKIEVPDKIDHQVDLKPQLNFSKTDAFKKPKTELHTYMPDFSIEKSNSRS